jgi:KRAB domain-containing zinc finger protein
MGVKKHCPYCPKILTSWAGRNWHIQLKHCTVKPELECEICHRFFPTEMVLKSHRRILHTSKKDYHCEICSQIFTKKEGLARHMEAKHLNLQLPCEQCGRILTNKRQLQRHLEYHKGEKNYECPVCFKGFAQNFVMRTHVEKLHPEQLHVLPPKGTIMNKKALQKMAEQRELENQYVKIDFEGNK